MAKSFWSRQMRKDWLLWHLFLLLVCLSGINVEAAEQCLGSGTEEQINAAFRRGGSYAVVSLCPGSVHRLQSPIVFTSWKQTLTTEGNPKDYTRALIVVEGERQATAIKSVVVDGNRPNLLRIPKGEALVQMGNAEDQVVSDCRLYEPRGWSCLHFREGDRKHCTGAQVRRNEIGPAGEEWDFDYDGYSEPSPRWGNPRADGISLACKYSTVEDNIVYDATDGGIVIFGSAGSEIKNNQIISRTRAVMGAINLVDMAPWDGDYSNTRVSGNTVSAHGGYIRSGINVGPAVWGDDTEGMVSGGTITNNLIEGDHIGYGIAVASARYFTITKNKSTAKYSGVKGPTCPTAPENADPMPFLINKGSSEGEFQKEFVNGEVQHIICIDPPTEDGEPYRPWRFRDSPEAIAARREEETLTSSPAMDAALSDGLVNYQMVLMEAMDAVSAKLKGAASEEEEHHRKAVRPNGRGESASPFTAVLKDLSTRLATLESGRKEVRGSLERMKADLKQYVGALRTAKRDQTGLTESVLSLARAAYLSNEDVEPIPEEVSEEVDEAPSSVIGPVVMFLALQLLTGAGMYAIYRLLTKRWDGKRGSYRKSKRGFGLDLDGTLNGHGFYDSVGSAGSISLNDHSEFRPSAHMRRLSDYGVRRDPARPVASTASARYTPQDKLQSSPKARDAYRERFLEE